MFLRTQFVYSTSGVNLLIFDFYLLDLETSDIVSVRLLLNKDLTTSANLDKKTRRLGRFGLTQVLKSIIREQSSENSETSVDKPIIRNDLLTGKLTKMFQN